MKILLIDDDLDLCQLTQKVLTKSGHIVSAFSDATYGIKKAKEFNPSLILMDVMLPGLSGPEVIDLLKKDPFFKDTPVIFLTALVSGEENSLQNEGLMVAGIKYPTLGKPYEIDQLLSMVNRYAK